MNLKSRKSLYEAALLGIVAVLILVVLIMRSGSAVPAPTPSNVEAIQTDFDTSVMEDVDQRRNTRPTLNSSSVGKTNPFRYQ